MMIMITPSQSAPARVLARARFYLFGTDVLTCAGCYGPPHVIEDRAYLYRYQIKIGVSSPPVCGQACIAMAVQRLDYKAKPLSDVAQRLRDRDRRNYAEERRLAREAAAEAHMALLRTRGEDAVAKAMADIIVARAAGQEACERHHLVSAGFTVDELTRLGPAAVARAAARCPDLRG